MTTTYTKRDIRAADMLAIILVGVGFVLFLCAPWPIGTASGKGSGTGMALWVVAGAFVLLGIALNLKIRQLIRNEGREPGEYPGVPD